MHKTVVTPLRVCVHTHMSTTKSWFTFTFAICCRPSVRLSSVCLSVTFMRLTQPIEIFGNVSTPFGTLAIQ